MCSDGDRRLARGAGTATVDPLEIIIPATAVSLPGILTIPIAPKGVVVFAHGRGGGRRSPRNAYVAEPLGMAGFAGVRFDLFTDIEQRGEVAEFDVGLLAGRLRAAADWVRRFEATKQLSIGYFGAGTGAAVALVAAAFDDGIRAVVCRGGNPELASVALGNVRAPTLLIVGGRDQAAMHWNEEALASLHCEKELRIVPHAGHLFEELGALDAVAQHSIEWFDRHIRGVVGGTRPVATASAMVAKTQRAIASAVPAASTPRPRRALPVLSDGVRAVRGRLVRAYRRRTFQGVPVVRRVGMRSSGVRGATFLEGRADGVSRRRIPATLPVLFVRHGCPTLREATDCTRG